jgi:nucleoside-diphosphate-sugar epimerase
MAALPENLNALVGHTGFVGGSLARQREFQARYNSANIDEIAEESFDTIVCAGVKAEKWRANLDPVADIESIDRLWNALRQAKTRKLILISTIDVYPNPVGVDETTAIDASDSQPYGKHRYELEARAHDHFDTLVIRLPGLFGKGLKKNALYDLLHSHDTDRIDSRGVFQFYDIERLAGDIDTAMQNDIGLLNVATEPLSIEEISRDCYASEFVNHIVDKPARYDMRSINAGAFGGSDGYLVSAAEVKDSLRSWVAAERGSQS